MGADPSLLLSSLARRVLMETVLGARVAFDNGGMHLAGRALKQRKGGWWSIQVRHGRKSGTSPGLPLPIPRHLTCSRRLPLNVQLDDGSIVKKRTGTFRVSANADMENSPAHGTPTKIARSRTKTPLKSVYGAVSGNTAHALKCGKQTISIFSGGSGLCSPRKAAGTPRKKSGLHVQQLAGSQPKETASVSVIAPAQVQQHQQQAAAAPAPAVGCSKRPVMADVLPAGIQQSRLLSHRANLLKNCSGGCFAHLSVGADIPRADIICGTMVAPKPAAESGGDTILGSLVEGLASLRIQPPPAASASAARLEMRLHNCTACRRAELGLFAGLRVEVPSPYNFGKVGAVVQRRRAPQ